jgi:hypothetical protein
MPSSSSLLSTSRRKFYGHGEGAESCTGEDSVAAVGARAAAALLGRARRGCRDVRAGAAPPPPPPRAAVPKQLAATAGRRRRATGQGQGGHAQGASGEREGCAGRREEIKN